MLEMLFDEVSAAIAHIQKLTEFNGAPTSARA